jgi:predicted transcriptional regulator
MSNRSKILAEEITLKLRDYIQETHDKLIHLAFLQNPNATEDSAIIQANKDLAEMLRFYINKFDPDIKEDLI